MIIRPLEAELFHADGRTDTDRQMDGRTDGETSMTRLIVDFRNIANDPKILSLKFSNKSDK